MVSLEHLAALDLILWLGTSERAAAMAQANQSTISRRSRSALQQFSLTLRRSVDGWRPCGDTRLLELERQVHQQARFRGRQPLRLQVPYWSRHRALQQLPEGWCAPPFPGMAVCEDPVTLLRQRVIDACLVTPTQLPPRGDDLQVIDLYRRPIELTVFDGGRQASPTPCRREFQSGPLRLCLLPFLPRSCQLRSREWFNALSPCSAPNGRNAGGARAADPDDGWLVAFLTPEMRQAQERPWVVAGELEPYPYVERLVVLAENAAAPSIQRLREYLLGQFASLAV